MATLAAPPAQERRNNSRFFMVMAFVMAAVIIAGFSLNLAMGRSTFAAPFAVHVHAGIFMGWLALYLAQHVTAASRNWPLHRSLGSCSSTRTPNGSHGLWKRKLWKKRLGRPGLRSIGGL